MFLCVYTANWSALGWHLAGKGMHSIRHKTQR